MFSGNAIPVITVVRGLDTTDQDAVLFASINESTSFVLNATDDGTVSYSFLENTYNALLSSPNAEGNVLVNVTVTDDIPGNLRLVGFCCSYRLTIV